MQITYQKRDGCIIQRLRSTMLPYKIGEITSMGWKVLNIEYEYNNKYYTELKYHMLIHKEKQKCIRHKELSKMFKREFKAFMYYLITIIILNCLKYMLGI